MATSTIFAQIDINDRKKAASFFKALEDSEKAQSEKKQTAPAISVTRNKNDIKNLMAKRSAK